MKYKVVLADKSEMIFEEKEAAFKYALENAKRLNKVTPILYTNDNFNWEELGLAYPTGMTQEGTGGFGFFKKLSTIRKK